MSSTYYNVFHCSKQGPSAFRGDNHQLISKCLSEYQSAYKLLPWQPVRQILKPSRSKLTKDTIKAHMEKKSVYGVDYANNTKTPRRVPPKRHKPELTCPKDSMDTKTTYKLEFYEKESCRREVTNPATLQNQVTEDNKEPFVGDSIYTASYPEYEKSEMDDCHQLPIKAKDNIEIPASLMIKSLKNPKSTAQEDFIHHQNFDRPTAIKPIENTQRPTEPLQSNTEYSDFYTNKNKDGFVTRVPSTKPVQTQNKSEKNQFCAVSTAMADFTKPKGFMRTKPCHPPISNHFIQAPFDGRTTFTSAYKPWPVKRQETPIWARKPEYKRPAGGFLVNSLYMHDYRDPQMPFPPKAIRPNTDNSNLISGKEREKKRFDNQTTYKRDFQAWENNEPPDSYKCIEVYKPPTEKMACETNQIAHYKGEGLPERIKLCRHPSQHRELSSNYPMTFVTTYNEDYTSPRPRSSPSKAVSAAQPSDKARINSAPNGSASPKTTGRTPNKPVQSIPKPALNLTLIQAEE